MNAYFSKKHKPFNYVICFVLLPWDLEVACRHFDNDLIEVLEMKAYFYNADKNS